MRTTALTFTCTSHLMFIYMALHELFKLGCKHLVHTHLPHTTVGVGAGTRLSTVCKRPVTSHISYTCIIHCPHGPNFILMGTCLSCSLTSLPTPFCSTVCIDNNTWKAEEWGRPDIIHHVSDARPVDVRWT